MIRYVSYILHCQKLPGMWDAVILANKWQVVVTGNNRYVIGHIRFFCSGQKPFREGRSSKAIKSQKSNNHIAKAPGAF